MPFRFVKRVKLILKIINSSNILYKNEEKKANWGVFVDRFILIYYNDVRYV